MASKDQIPQTPRVISPTPTPSESPATKDYFGPLTRSVTKSSRQKSTQIPEDRDNESSGSDRDPEKRARTRSRSPVLDGGLGGKMRVSGLTSVKPNIGMTAQSGKPVRRKGDVTVANGSANGHLSPQSANRGSKWSWREFSRSPSPLGLIPIHTKWRHFIHKHEIPRKTLHVSIGFITLYFYATGVQPEAIHPALLRMFVPVAALDVLRHNSKKFNQAYIKVVGALMRESEVDGWNGTLSYLVGAWAVMRFCPKDVAVMSVLLLSWCDTAASTFGRLWGRYTPRIRKGKSLAGSIAAMVCGMATAALFWGVIAPYFADSGYDSGEHKFAFQGTLTLPQNLRTASGLSKAATTIGGGIGLAVMSLVTGFIGAASEAIDLWGWDDNFTIPILSAAGLWGFLHMMT